MKVLLSRGGEEKRGGVQVLTQAVGGVGWQLGLSPAYLQSLPPDLADDLPSLRDKFVLDNLLQLGQHMARNHGLMEADHIPT